MKIRQFTKAISQSFDLRTLVFGGFLCAGAFKNDPRLAFIPVDLTLIFGFLTLLFCVRTLIRDRLNFPIPILWITILFLFFLLPVLWGPWDLYLGGPGNPYEKEKPLRLFTITFASAVAPFFIVRTIEDLRRLLNVLAVFGIVQGIDALAVVTSGSVLARLSGFGQNAIILGRIVGIPIVWVAVLALERRIKPALAFAVTIAMSLGILSSGSRGPLLAVLTSILILVVSYYREHLAKTFAILGVATALFFTFQVTLQSVMPASMQRIQDLMEGRFGSSGSSEGLRIEGYERSLERIASTPLGTGWATFDDQLLYPHNFFIEIALEAGWASFAFALFLVLRSARLAYRAGNSLPRRGAFALFVYFFVNAMVSGDLNHNKFLFVFIAIALASLSDMPQTSERLSAQST